METPSEVGGPNPIKKASSQAVIHNLDMVNALYEIVNSTTNPRIMLDSILLRLSSNLCVDAGAILLNSSPEEMYGMSAVGFQRQAPQEMLETLVSIFNQVSAKGRMNGSYDYSRLENLALNSNEFADLLKSENFNNWRISRLASNGVQRGMLALFNRNGNKSLDEYEVLLDVISSLMGNTLENLALNQDMQNTLVELEETQKATVEGWVKLLDFRDKETEEHTVRVTNLALFTAVRLGYSKEELDRIQMGAMLHDIGKIAIEDAILSKPGPLTDEEWVHMRKHPEIAIQMLSHIPFLKDCLDIPYSHHEKWDGSGYPRGIAGEEIPMPARIFALVDVWDALRSNRPYRNAWTHEKALDYIASNAGTHFDPCLVDMFIEMIGELTPAEELSPPEN
jgi:putative nucleotidyltransferase with HDIG domain